MDDRSPDKKYAFPSDEMLRAEEKRAKENEAMKWKCKHCGKVVEGDQPPEKCPRCGFPGSQFEKTEDEE